MGCRIGHDASVGAEDCEVVIGPALSDETEVAKARAATVCKSAGLSLRRGWSGGPEEMALKVAAKEALQPRRPGSQGSVAAKEEVPLRSGDKRKSEQNQGGIAAKEPSAAEKRSKDEFECFSENVSHRRMPIVVFTDGVADQCVWDCGSVVKGKVKCPTGRPDMHAADPIAMSPAYLGFAIDPDETRYLHYNGVGIVFQRPPGGKFMQPSIDTILVCHGLERLFDEGHAFSRVVDIGSGSGFIGKFASVHAPGPDELNVCLIDVDPAALRYSRSAGFNATSIGTDGRPVTWNHQVGDAAQFLERDMRFDLLISNPPYIPTKEECMGGALMRKTQAGNTCFWEGVGLALYLLELFASGRCAPRAHLVMVLTSLSLKAPMVRDALASLQGKGVRCRSLLEREVAWKAWYAGPSGLDYLLASDREHAERQRVGEVDFFIGAARPGDSRLQKIRDGRMRHYGYHWQVAYVLDFYYE